MIHVFSAAFRRAANVPLSATASASAIVQCQVIGGEGRRVDRLVEADGLILKNIKLLLERSVAFLIKAAHHSSPQTGLINDFGKDQRCHGAVLTGGPLVKAKALFISLGRIQRIRATCKRIALVVVPAIAMATAAAQGDVLTVSNGEFLNYSGPGVPGQNGNDSFNRVNPVGWTSGSSGPGGSLIFVTTTAAINNGSVYLPVYGPTPGVQASPSNPIPNPIPGSNFVEADGNPYYGNSFSYQLSGLTVGKTYQLSFFEAFSQQTGFTGTISSDEWVVGLGTSGSQFVFNTSNPNQYTYTYSDPGGSVVVAPTIAPVQEGFTGWQQVTVNLTADATNDVLTFLAWGNNGNTTNVPPIAFLDIGANGNAVPTPTPSASAGGLLLLVLVMFGSGARRLLRRRRSNPAAV